MRTVSLVLLKSFDEMIFKICEEFFKSTELIINSP